MARYLTEVIRIRVTPEMRDEMIRQAEADKRSAGSLARDAIRAHLKKGKRSQ